MAIPVPNLDNMGFEDLVAEAKSLIPVYAPQWTNHNLSDPGITLIELFAWLCEMVIYRVDQIPEENYLSFLKLYGIQLDEDEELQSGIRRAVEQFSQSYRSVTAKDFEKLACEGLMEMPGILEKYPDLNVRAICHPNRDMENERTAYTEQFGHISVVLVVKTRYQKELLDDMPDIRRCVKQYLAKRKIISTRVHVVEPDYQEIRITLQVAAKGNELEKTIQSAVEQFIDPITGGEDKAGWTPGRNLYLSDIYHLIEDIPGVDHVIRAELEAPGLKPDQLIKLKELIVEVES